MLMMRMSQSSKLDGRLYTVTLSDKEFRRLSEFIHTECGIKMPPGKRTMLEGRLRKRLRDLGIGSFTEYYEYLLSPQGLAGEYVHMINVVTTNKTDFFREPAHFDYLVQKVLPQLVDCGLGVGRRLNVWSAGCSTGEEPYTLAIVLSEFAQNYRSFDFSILATDISTKVLEKARTGIYDHDRVKPVSLFLRKRYLLRNKDRAKKLVRVAPELRSKVRFQRVNFMDRKFGISDKMAVIFCRNVLIYFDRPTQEQVLARVCRHLIPGGYLFTGHSETLQGLNLPLTNVATTVYRKL